MRGPVRHDGDVPTVQDLVLTAGAHLHVATLARQVNAVVYSVRVGVWSSS
jgi:hypothetical protein